MALPEVKTYEVLKGTAIAGTHYKEGQQFQAALPKVVEEEGLYRKLYRIVPAETVLDKETNPEPKKAKK